MRDIRADIKERIEAAQAREKRLETELEEVMNYIDDLQTLLSAENSRLKTADVAEPPTKPEEDLDKFIVRLVKRQAQEKPDIAVAVQAAGYIKPGQSAGRVVHAKLLGMVNDQVLRVRSDKKYEVSQ